MTDPKPEIAVTQADKSLASLILDQDQWACGCEKCHDKLSKLIARHRLASQHQPDDDAMTDPKPEIAVTIADIIRDVAELPDRTSPDDWPDAMLVTGGELGIILSRYLSLEHQPDDAAVEREKIVAWLRADADLTEIEGRKIVANSHGISVRDIADWQSLVATKRGLADAIERGDHLKS